MPFDFDAYQEKCNGMSTEELHKEWDNYTRQIAAGATSTATSVLLSGATGGVSLIGLGLSAPRIHNARKKREMIQAGLKSRGTTHHTHAKDVLVPMATVGAVGGITLALGVSGAEFVPSSGGIEHSALDYIATQAAASGAVTYLKYRARERAKKYSEDAPEPGLQDSQTWPQEPAVLEKFGPQLGPVIHQYSTFGHVDQYSDAQPNPSSIQDQFSQDSFSSFQLTSNTTASFPSTPMISSSFSTASVTSSSVSATLVSSSTVLDTLPSPPLPVINSGPATYPSKQNQNGRSQSMPSSNSSYTMQNGGDSVSQAMITDDQLDVLVASLSDEEQIMLLMKLELELRTPGGSQPLHRKKAVHATNAQRPHISHDDYRISRHDSEGQLTSPDFFPSPRVSVQLSDAPFDLDEPDPVLERPQSNLPLERSQATPHSASLPLPSSLAIGVVGFDTSTVAVSNAEIESSRITRKPLVISPRQSYSSEFTPGQYQPSHLKDSSQYICYHPAPSTASDHPNDNPPRYTLITSQQTTNLSQDSTIKEQLTTDSPFPSSSGSSPPPPYYIPPPSATVSGPLEDYFDQPTSPDNEVQLSAEPDKYSVEGEQQNMLGIMSWQWETGSETVVKRVEGPVYTPVQVSAPET